MGLQGAPPNLRIPVLSTSDGLLGARACLPRPAAQDKFTQAAWCPRQDPGSQELEFTHTSAAGSLLWASW